jgi:hypothetical protein
MRCALQNLETLGKIFNAFQNSDYNSIQEELHGNLSDLALISMAKLDFERTLPYLKERLRNISNIPYEWGDHPKFPDPLILPMSLILEDRIDQNLLQASIDHFKPLSDLERRFFDYTLRCLFYIEPQKEQEIVL